MSDFAARQRVNDNGEYNATENPAAGSIAQIVHSRVATPDVTNQDVRQTGVQGTNDNTVYAADVALFDSNGDAFTALNPLPVAPVVSTPGTKVIDFDEAVNTAQNASTNHDYSVPNGVSFTGAKIQVSSRNEAKYEIQLGDGAASEVFTTQFVTFVSPSNQHDEIDIACLVVADGGANSTTIRIVKTNLDNQPSNLYTTISGITA